MRNVLIVVLLAITQFGCSAHRIWFGSDLSTITSIKLYKSESGEVVLLESDKEAKEGYSLEGALISWSPEFNAAFLNADGKGCIQPAAYARTGDATINLPASAVGAGTGQIDGSYTQLLTELANVTDQSTFLSVGFYGICQLHANGVASDELIASMVKDLLIQAVAMGGSSSNNVNTAPEKPDAKMVLNQ